MSTKQDSDAKIDPPATVITTRTRIITPRPTVSWAAALVAMGVFVGLVTAVIARGDADSLIDATASFVDPSGSHVSGSSSGAIASLQSKFVAPTRAFSAMIDSATTPASSDDAKAVAVADLPAAQAPKPAPVAYAAPARRSYWHPARQAPVAKQVKEVKDEPKAEAKEEKVAAAPAPKATSKHAAAAAPAKAGASDDDVESASAADALAKAQLEASLK